MAIIPYSKSDFRDTDKMVVTVDKNQRIYLNKNLQKFLNCEGKPINLYLGYDPANKRIGIAKPEIVRLTDTRSFRFTKTAFASARNFISRFQIPYENGPLRFVYFGKEDGWLTFQLENHIAEDEKQKGAAMID